MAAKVKWDRGAWWIFTHYRGRRTKKRFGPSKSDKRQAEAVARKIDAALALGTFSPEDASEAIPCAEELQRWHRTYSLTMKPSYAKLTRSGPAAGRFPSAAYLS